MGRSVQVETARSQCSGSAAYELRLLGGFQLLRHGDDVETLPSTQRVLAFLALNDRFMPRAYVAESLLAGHHRREGARPTCGPPCGACTSADTTSSTP